MKKKILFKIVAISLPFIFILILELMLRLFGYGDNYNLFNKVTAKNGTEYLSMNSKLSKKYFNDNGFRSDNQSDLFLKKKTDSTFRVFVQGASTAVGFPYYRGGSFPRMLKHRLSLTFPQKNIEIINTGITAVNSYTLYDITDEIIDQKPDLIIIYAGHNEYYGALGVGSSASVGSYPKLIRTYLALKKCRFFQLLNNSYSTLFNAKNKKTKNINETTLMEVMAKNQRIPYHSKVYNAGTNQFRGNLIKILAKYQKHNIPVILSTLVSNEKDIKPFISDILENEEQFIEAIDQNNPEAYELAKKNAKAAYILGRYFLDKKLDSAKKYLHIAKELDLLRFRAPKKINDIIIDLAEKNELPLVDMKEVFLAHSPLEVIGNELISEHVHPNIKGYFIMADAYYNKIKELNLIDNWENHISFDEAIQDIPVTSIDSIRGKLAVDDLKKSWPYNLSMSGVKPLSPYYLISNPTFEERKAINLFTNKETWEQVMRQAYHKYQSDADFAQARHVAQSLIFEFSEQAEVYNMAGEMSLKLNDYKNAAYYFLKSNQLEISSKSALQLASVYMQLNKTELAYKTLLEAKNKGFHDKLLNDKIKKLKPILKK